MAVVEDDADGVVADGLEADDAYPALAARADLLGGAMALHLGGRALDPQELGRIAERAAVVEFDLEPRSSRLTRISTGQGSASGEGSAILAAGRSARTASGMSPPRRSAGHRRPA
jgi:hypothetical protein